MLSSKRDTVDKLAWRISVPIFRNGVILKQLGLAVGVPFGLVALAIVLASGESVYALYGLGLIGAVLLLTWLTVMVLYNGRYEAEFELGDAGAVCRTQAKQARKNRNVGTLTVVLGLLSGKPSAAGAGLLAQSRQEVFLPWSRVRKIACKPQSRTILLRGGWTDNIALFCTPENYSAVEQFIMMRIKPEALAVKGRQGRD